jgi:hypothetical protein
MQESLSKLLSIQYRAPGNRSPNSILPINWLIVPVRIYFVLAFFIRHGVVFVYIEIRESPIQL